MTHPGKTDFVSTMALMTALGAGAGTAGGAPEWVQLIPAGEFKGIDGRGPYHVANAQAVIASSMARAQGKLPVDENHGTQRAAKLGLGAPARGWIVEMATREDGIWGRVEWTEAGRALVGDGAYRGISPVFEHTASGGVVRILSAALTNDPNLSQLATLHDNLSAEERGKLEPGDFAVPEKRELPIKDADHVKLAWDMVDRTMGLSAEERAGARRRILARAKELGIDTSGWQKPAAHTHTHAGNEDEMDLSELRRALGADAATDDAGVITAAVRAVTERAEHARQTETRVGELTTQVAALTTQIAEMGAAGKKTRAEAFIDQAIRDGKPILAVRDALIAQHMADPAGTETLVSGIPSLHTGGVVGNIQVMDAEDGDALTEQEMSVAKAFGLDPKEAARAKRLKRLGRADEIGKKRAA